MLIQFVVSVEVSPREKQNQKEFDREDGKAMVTYLKEKVDAAIKDAWQYNAYVSGHRFQFIHQPKS